jgi:acyl-CoA synthetase (AMP-forming)/AMP-acid ligase II
VGKAPPHVQLGVFILKDDKPTLQKAPPYVIGAIGTKGPHIMNGYWKRGSDDDEASGIGIIQQWLITNDLGYMDNNGRLYFCGRLNDVIRTGGETVFAPEVEAIIIKLPNVDECAVFALPDERFGECVCVAIVKKQINSDVNNQSHLVNGGSDNLSENIREICERQKLSSFKRPRRVFLVNALPRNSSGKVLKNELKRIFSRISNMQSKL